MILASGSPRRRELLGALGFDLTIRPADIDESRLPGEHPRELVKRLAHEKAHHVLDTNGVGDDGFLRAQAECANMDAHQSGFANNDAPRL